jgi:tetratricopeptide (TPR) repeat protein
MGIAAGGSIEQQIIEDTYGVESWDETAFRDITIHIVNSEMYERITGLKAPETPISADDYKRYGIPWFSDYQEDVPALAPAAAFKRVRSVAQIDMNRGLKFEDASTKVPIQPEVILRIQTPKLRERFDALIARAKSSVHNERFEIAIRESSLALDLAQSDFRFIGDRFTLLLIRARSHLAVGNAADAESDASNCLELEPNNIQALTIRSQASLEIGEYLLAKADAEKVLESDPDSEEALFVIKQSGFFLRNRSQATRCIPEIQQVGIPKEKEERFLSAAKALIDKGIRTPEALAALLLELGDSTSRDLRKYAQAMWDRFGLVDPALRGSHDWAKIFTDVLFAPSEHKKPTQS